MLLFQNFVHKLTDSGVGVLAALGNHDARGAALPSALEIFERDVTLSLTPSLFDFGDVVIATLPWTPPSRIVAGLPAEHRGDVFDLAAQALAGGAKVLGERCAVEFPDATPILVGHWAVSGASLPNGMTSSQLRETVIHLEALTSAGFKYVALGHLHKPEVLATEPPTWYCGSPWVSDFGEADIPHGVWILDTEGEGALRFVPIEDRPFITYDELPPAGFSIAGQEGAVVRVRYEIAEDDPHAPDPSTIQRRLLEQGAAKVFVQPTVIRAVRARSQTATASLTDAQALEMWMDAQDVVEGERAALREMHAHYEEALR